MILLLETGTHSITADINLCIAFATTAVSTDTPGTLGNFDKIVIFELSMNTLSGTKLAVIYIFVHLFLLAASYADKVTITLS